jgi:CheY-like chemotaxis protein
LISRTAFYSCFARRSFSGGGNYARNYFDNIPKNLKNCNFFGALFSFSFIRRFATIIPLLIFSLYFMNEKKKVLVVDDEAALRRALVDTLKVEEGIELFEAADGEEAFVSIKKNQPDLVLLDIAMPKMDGLTVIQKLKAENALGKTKIMFLTNSSELSQIAAAMSSGAFDYLVKADWDMKDVVAKVKEKLA